MSDKDPDEVPAPQTSNGSSVPNTQQTDTSIILRNLSEGFKAVRKRRDGAQDAVIPLDAITPPFLRHVTVNWIDATSSTTSVTTPTKKKKTTLYQKLDAVFARHNYTIRNVQYQHVRSGATGTIERLVVQPIWNKTGLVTFQSDDNEETPWSTSDASSGMDPSEWHQLSLCHVYIAACENLEHYRTKVKPAIQAFLSQIVDNAKVVSAQYVIVYVPTGDKSSDDATAGPRSRVGAALARAVVASRNRNSTSMSREGSQDTGDSVTSGDVMETEGASSASSEVAIHTAHLSRVDKELARRLATDFPNGNVCTLSCLVQPEEDDSDAFNELQKYEFGTFLKSLGCAVADGFRERCKRFDEELRQQDSLRALGAEYTMKARMELIRQRKKFTLSYFFLVKESLAFLYEKMNLPSEALLQYDELRAFVPDMNGSEVYAAEGVDVLSSGFAQAALTGDAMTFRKRLRTMEDVQPIAPIIQLYLFARETALLFKMNKSVDVVKRCRSFVRVMHSFKHQQLPKNCDKELKLNVEKWAFQFCWDVKNACDNFIADEVSESQVNGSEGGDGRPKLQRGLSRRLDESLARCICDLLEFARQRLLEIGDLALEENPIRKHDRFISEEMEKPWSPWRLGALIDNEATEQEGEDAGELDERDFIATAMTSSDAFVEQYLELMRLLEAFNRFSGRRRTAARLAVDIAGLHILRGDRERASNALTAASEAYAKEHWDESHFLTLFRIAGYRRRICTADDYAATLIRCFTPAHYESAPQKALNQLFTDLEAVFRSKEMSRTYLRGQTIFDPVLGLEGHKPTQRSGSVKDLFKMVYVVGDKAAITIDLTSYVPKDIEIESLTIDMVPFRTYIASIEDSTDVKEEDIFKRLRLAGPVKLSPGLNGVSFDWVPMTPGQFVLNSVAITWKSVMFTYSIEDMQRPTIRVDIVPSEPTQSISLSPDYLLPGHPQPVKLDFRASTDIVEQGNVKLVCAPGLMLESPESSGSWRSACELALPPCPPGKSVQMVFVVKSNSRTVGESDEQGSHVLHATVVTKYRCPYPQGIETPTEEDITIGAFLMDAVLEAKVTTLEHPALAVECIEVVPYANNRALVNIAVKSNAPGVTLVKGWDLALPSFLQLVDSGDLNECLAGAQVLQRELLSVAFECQFHEPTGTPDSPASCLFVDVEDERGQSFREALLLDLRRPSSFVSYLPNPTMAVSIRSSQNEGPLGVPIKLAYNWISNDLAGLPGKVCYSFRVDPTNWIIGGKTDGVVAVNHSTNDFSVDVVCIPARPGFIPKFPSLSLSYRPPKSETSIALSTTDEETLGFECHASLVHTSVAVPMLAKQPSSDK